MKSTYKSETIRDCSPPRAPEPRYRSPLGRLIHEWEHPEIGPIRIIDRAEEGEPFTPVVEVDHPGVYADLEDLEEAGLLVDALGEEIARLVMTAFGVPTAMSKRQIILTGPDASSPQEALEWGKQAGINEGAAMERARLQERVRRGCASGRSAG